MANGKADKAEAVRQAKRRRPQRSIEGTIGRKPAPFVGDLDYVPEPGVIKSPMLSKRGPRDRMIHDPYSHLEPKARKA